MDVTEFTKIVWDYYAEHKRPMPWRSDSSPYNVLVSEIMLQQTQVSRVLVKFPEFMERFPSMESLAQASPAEVITAWQGLGYNRRALNLQRAAQMIMSDFGGQLPQATDDLIRVPGIGPGTAGSLAAFAYNKPVVFIETNIRRVFIHHFFRDDGKDLKGPEVDDRKKVSDADILPFVEAVLDRENPREWYYALMDYGSALAKQVPNPNRRSKHHSVQSKFEGSSRQLRGKVLRALLANQLSADELSRELDDERLPRVLSQLTNEKMIELHKGKYRLPQ